MSIYKNHIYSILGKELNNENIHYFVFKGSYKLESPYSGKGDLDIYVMPYHAEKFISISKSLGFIHLEVIDFSSKIIPEIYFIMILK